LIGLPEPRENSIYADHIVISMHGVFG
jgi:hypothetical protein